MLSYEDFKTAVRNELKAYMPMEYQGHVFSEHVLHKINRTTEAFTLTPPGEPDGTSASPTLGYTDLYQWIVDDIPLPVVLTMAAEMMQYEPEEFLGQDFLEGFEDPSMAKKDLTIAFINRKRNEELLKDVPHFDFLDLAAIAVLQHGEDAEYSCTVNNALLQEFAMTREEMLETACLNTFQRFPTRLEVIQGMLTAGCENSLFGAACLLDVEMLKQVSAHMDSDILVIPESIHTLCLIPAEGNRPEHVLQAHRMISHMERNTRDFLSDNIYVFSRNEEKLSVYGGGA